MKAEEIIANVVAAIDSAVAKLKEGKSLTFITVDNEKTRFLRYELDSPTRLSLVYRYNVDYVELDEDGDDIYSYEYGTAISPDDGVIRIKETSISGMDEDGEPFTLYLNR